MPFCVSYTTTKHSELPLWDRWTNETDGQVRLQDWNFCSCATTSIDLGLTWLGQQGIKDRHTGRLGSGWLCTSTEMYQQPRNTACLLYSGERQGMNEWGGRIANFEGVSLGELSQAAVIYEEEAVVGICIQCHLCLEQEKTAFSQRLTWGKALPSRD